ncbi:hypothetical protein WJX84_002543 [Apatococcus fuscideae]|uniref:Ubiquinone biosynthesis protein n=1 Tax=Apatococcus fuscideae TaxID=2026836 RepID=A0AAW1T8G3_9CHLO
MSSNTSSWNTPLLIAGGLAATGLVLWPVLTWAQVQNLEKPKYKVLKAFGKVKGASGVEIREYAPFLIAEVIIESESMKEALGMGFKQIANFIFGNNAAPGSGKSESVSMTSPVILKHGQDKPASMKGGDGEKIAMTTPVATEMSDGRYTVSFVMPSKYTKESLPKPKTDSVAIKEIPAHTLAALTWRGAVPSQQLVDKKTKLLLDALLQHGIKVDEAAKTRLYQYFPPWTPFWLRTQDVLLPVDLEFTRVGDSAVVQPPSVSRAQQQDPQQQQRSSAGGADTRHQILHAALQRVGELGWSQEALEAGCRDQGLSPAAVGMLPGGPAELVQFFIDQCNAELAAELARRKNELRVLQVGDRIKAAVQLRLEMLAPHMDTWPQAVALMAQPSSAMVGCRQLAFIVDEIWHAAGDTSSDTSWYTKRALLAGVYASTELYMLTDYSPGYADTWESLDRRLADVMRLGAAARDARAAAASMAGSLASTLSWVQQQMMQQMQQQRDPQPQSDSDAPPGPSAPQWPSKEEPPSSLYTPAPPPTATMRPPPAP